MISPIVLIGLRCAGKSSVGRLLAKELKLDFVDLDEEISLHEGSGRSAGELLEQLGEEPFRDLESVALARSLSRSELVLAAGGGALEREENRSLLRGHARVIWLDAPDAELLKRRARKDADVGRRARDAPRLLAVQEPDDLRARRLRDDHGGIRASELDERLPAVLLLRLRHVSGNSGQHTLEFWPH